MGDAIRGDVQLWLFDIDGTLIAPSADQLQAWVATFREVFGLAPPAAAITAQLGQTFAEVVGAVVRAHGQPDPAPRMGEALRVYTRHVRDGLAARPARLLHGARELLQFLRGQGHLVGVITGNLPEEGEPKLIGAGLRRLLDLVVYAEPATPARDHLVRRAVAEAGTLGFAGGFAATVVVGDSVHDVASARRTGAVAVAVSTGLTPAEALRAARPDLLVPDLATLLRTLSETGARWNPSARPA